jgi:hypothetical protein
MMLLSKNAIAEYIMTDGVGAIFWAGYIGKTATRLFSSRTVLFITPHHSAPLVLRKFSPGAHTRRMVEYAGDGWSFQARTERSALDERQAMKEARSCLMRRVERRRLSSSLARTISR